MDFLIEDFEARIIIYANEYTLEKILFELGRKYGENELEYYIERPLSRREIEVLKLVINGKSNAEIAKTLYITQNTVKAHMSKIMEKLAVTDRVQAAVKATRQNLI